MPWWAHVWSRARLLGRVLFFVLMGVAVVMGIYIGIAGLVDASEPTYWGTFTQKSCVEGGRYGCRSVGTWVSDDGSIRLKNVYLDGKPGGDGTVNAQYQPKGVNNDADANIVHTSTGVALKPIVPWALIGMGLGFSAWYWRKWRGTWR